MDVMNTMFLRQPIQTMNTILSQGANLRAMSTARVVRTAQRRAATTLAISALLITLIFVGLTNQANAATSSAKNSAFGLGIILGEPTGLTAKWRPDGIGSDHALQFALSYSFSDFFLVSGDYLFVFPGAFGRKTTFISQLDPYVGIGGALFVSTKDYVYRTSKRYYYEPGSSSVGVGVRVPVGIEWTPSKPPIGVFIELAPGVGLAPSTFLFVEGGVGARYFF